MLPPCHFYSASASTKKRVRNLASELARAHGIDCAWHRLRMASIAPSTRVTNPGFVFRYNGGQYMTVAAFALERGFRSSSLPRFTTLEEHEFHRSETLMVRDIIDARSLKDVPRELKVGQVDLADAAAIRAVNHGDWARRFPLGSEKKTYRWKACRALFKGSRLVWLRARGLYGCRLAACMLLWLLQARGLDAGS